MSEKLQIYHRSQWKVSNRMCPRVCPPLAAIAGIAASVPGEAEVPREILGLRIPSLKQGSLDGTSPEGSGVDSFAMFCIPTLPVQS